MKILLITVMATMCGLAFANHTIDFNDSKDTVTCNNGAYTLSMNSSQSEINRNCHVVATSASHGSKALPRLIFDADNDARVSCKFKASRVDKCEIVD